MHKKDNYLPFFFVFFGLSLLLILIGRLGISESTASFFNKTTSPVKNSANILILRGLQSKAIKDLEVENARLKKELTIKKEILDENAALKSQFRFSEGKSQGLIPAKVVGQPGFLPGITLPEYLIINKGYKSGVSEGSGVVLGNNLVGKVIKAYPDFSKIELITNKNSSFIAEISEDPEINGVIKGQGGDGLIFDNVPLSDELKKGSEILTKGDRDESGNGYPPNLAVGKIVSVEKKQSELFQKAKIISPIDFKNLSIVFVIKGWQ
jgi:rod shape-determining protein MreC